VPIIKKTEHACTNPDPLFTYFEMVRAWRKAMQDKDMVMNDLDKIILAAKKKLDEFTRDHLSMLEPLLQNLAQPIIERKATDKKDEAAAERRKHFDAMDREAKSDA
jgi:hypothetical protein